MEWFLHGDFSSRLYLFNSPTTLAGTRQQRFGRRRFSLTSRQVTFQQGGGTWKSSPAGILIRPSQSQSQSQRLPRPDAKRRSDQPQAPCRSHVPATRRALPVSPPCPCCRPAPRLPFAAQPENTLRRRARVRPARPTRKRRRNPLPSAEAPRFLPPRARSQNSRRRRGPR